jgi:lipoate-protein ligase A
MLIVQLKSRDVYRNLAMEEWLLDHAQGRGPILFLCVNDPCVVIGKNQNPWRECRLSRMKEEGVPLARRISGGGAVYHDPGNLNVGIIVPRTEYIEQKQYDLIFQTLETFGIHASRVGKNSLAVGGKKISGQAFCFRGQHVLHHGTLLVDADLKRLGRYLGPDVEGIETRAVASVPAKVMNLSQAASLTVETLSSALIDTFKKEYGSSGVWECWSDSDVLEKNEAQLLPMLGKNSSNDWKLCHTPRFSFRGLEVERGRIANREGNPLFEEWLKNER